MISSKAILKFKKLLGTLGFIPIFAGIYFISYWLRFEGQLGEIEIDYLRKTILWVLFAKLIVFSWFQIRLNWKHYITFHDLMILGQASILSALLMALGDFLFFPGLNIPRSVFLMDWGGTIVLIGGMQAVVRLMREHGTLVFSLRDKTRVFIVGVNDSGEALLRAIRRSAKLPYRVVGFIAENEDSLGVRIGGVPVIGTLEQTCQLAKKHHVNEVLIAAGELPGIQVRRLVEDGRQQDMRVTVLPSFEQLLHGRVSMSPRSVSIEDLLRRDPVQLDQTKLKGWLEERVLLVTGSAGSIGSEICRQLLQFNPKKIILTDRSETGQFFLERELHRLAKKSQIEVCIGDITDATRMEFIFKKYRPNIVFHAAAYKHVPLMESNVGEAVKNITLATRRLADLADKFQVSSFVMISTDKAVNPTSVMGASKRIAEIYIQAKAEKSSCRFVTVRFGNVLDSAGSVVPIFREQIARGGPVQVTHPDMVRYFMTIPEASQLVIQAGAMGQGGEIFVLDMGDPVQIVNLASDMIRLSGLQIGSDIEIEFTGMRPGEKLYEELHSKNEQRTKTSHPKIRVADCVKHSFTQVLSDFERLEGIAEFSDAQVINEISQLVPEYQPSRNLNHLDSRKAA